MMLLAEQSTARTLVDVRLHHGHHRIDGAHKSRAKVGLVFDPCVFEEVVIVEPSRRQRQMAASREAQHSYFVGVDMVFFSMGTHPLQRPLCIGDHIRVLSSSEDGSVAVSKRRNTCGAVFEHKSGDALALQPHGNVMNIIHLKKVVVLKQLEKTFTVIMS